MSDSLWTLFSESKIWLSQSSFILIISTYSPLKNKTNIVVTLYSCFLELPVKEEGGNTRINGFLESESFGIYVGEVEGGGELLGGF